MYAVELTCFLTRAVPRLGIRPFCHLTNKDISISKENLKITKYLNNKGLFTQERYCSNESNQNTSEFRLISLTKCHSFSFWSESFLFFSCSVEFFSGTRTTRDVKIVPIALYFTNEFNSKRIKNALSHKPITKHS